jgi:hypothetical protein
VRIVAAFALVVALAGLTGCGHSPSSPPPSATATSPAASVPPAPASFVGMWQNASGQVLFVERTASGYRGTFYDGGVKSLHSALRQSGHALVGVGKPADRWKVVYDAAQGKLILGGPWAPMSFTKAPPDAAGLSGGSAGQTDPFVGAWRTLGQTTDRSGYVVIAKSQDGYRVSMIVSGDLFGSYTFYRNGDAIQDFPPTASKPKDRIRWVFRYAGRPGQLVMEQGNGLPHVQVRESMSTALPSPSPTP